MGGSSSTTTNNNGGIESLRVADPDDHAAAEDGQGMSPGSEMAMENDSNSSPTAIIADEGEENKEGGVRMSTGGVEGAGGGADTVTPRESGDAVNVTNNDMDDDEGGVDGGQNNENDEEEEDVADDESDYSYTYEDEDEGHYSGFLIPTDNPFENSSNSLAASSSAGVNDDGATTLAASSVAAAAGGAVDSQPRTISRAASRLSESGRTSPVPETNPDGGNDRKQKWREPTRAAVNMSLRAEKEKTGGRRRLASDLYKIMMADTAEAGFSLEPCDEDSMDKWCIKLFGFDEDANLAKDLTVCGMDHVELEMGFPDQYPFEPPFVRVVKPRFKRQTGFVMSGALCMELLTNDGWNPINDIESVIVSIRSLMVVGDGRLQAAVDMGRDEYKKVLEEVLKKRKMEEEGKMPAEEAAQADEDEGDDKAGEAKRKRAPSDAEGEKKGKGSGATKRATGGSYSAAEAQSAYDHLSKYHKKEGWDKSGWWSRKG